MWTAIVACLVGWIVFTIVAHILLALGTVSKHTGCLVLACLFGIASPASFLAALGMGVWKLIVYINS